MSKPAIGLAPVMISNWPTEHRDLWRKALVPGSLLREGGLAATWATETTHNVIRSWGLWLAWVRMSVPDDFHATPADQVDRARLREFIDYTKGYWADYTVGKTVNEIHHFLRATAGGQDWRWIQKVVDRSNAEAKPARPKHPRLVDSGEIFRTGIQIMHGSWSEASKGTHSECCTYRDGLALAMLAARPFRRRNMLVLALGRTLSREGKCYWVRFAAKDTKGGTRPINMPYPQELTCWINRYFETVLPILARGRCIAEFAHIWLSKQGNVMGPTSFSHWIKRIACCHLGKDLSPHLFRDCAATSIAYNDPLHIGIAKDILGHSDPRSAEASYNQATMVSASRSISANLYKVRRECD